MSGKLNVLSFGYLLLFPIKEVVVSIMSSSRQRCQTAYMKTSGAGGCPA